jgi:DNA-binding MarR family transcriptional regulator
MNQELSEDREVMAEQQHVFSLMARVGRKYRTEMKRQLDLGQVSPRELEVLGLLFEGRAQTASALARASGVTRQLMHRVLKRLERQELIQRWVGNNDEVKAGLTRSGEALLRETESVARIFRASVLARFGVQHHVALRALLCSLDEVLDTARQRPDFLHD